MIARNPAIRTAYQRALSVKADAHFNVPPARFTQPEKPSLVRAAPRPSSSRIDMKAVRDAPVLSDSDTSKTRSLSSSHWSEAANKSQPEGSKIGVILASHGDINSLDEVPCYAKTAVRKNRAIPIPNRLRGITADLGWPLLKEEIDEEYRRIGIRTDYRQNSQTQAMALKEALRSQGVSAEVRYGFNFTKPFIAEAMDEFAAKGIEKVVVINQGAQFSLATSQENFNDVMSYLDNHSNYRPDVVGIRQFSSNPAFRELLAQRIRQDIAKKFPGAKPQDVAVFMGSHGLPRDLLKKGDPATMQMQEALADIRKRLPEYKIYHGYLNDDFFPGNPWTKPAARDRAHEVAAGHYKYILLDGRLSFTVNHRATLYDLNYEARAIIAKESPESHVVFAENFDDDPELAHLLARSIVEATQGRGDTDILYKR